MGDEIVKASIFRSHFEAVDEIPDERDQLAYLKAIASYQFYGIMPEGLSPIVRALMRAILPVLEKEVEGRGGRPDCDIPAEEIASKKEELGSASAAAEHFGISERTVYRKLKSLTADKTGADSHCQKLTADKTDKTKEERRKKNEEGMNEEREKDEQEENQGVGQSPPAELQAAPAPLETSASQNSVPFPTGQVLQDAQGEADGERQAKRAKSFVPPTVEEVAEYCEKRENGVDAEAFVAFYASKGWFVGKNKMKDWRQAVITWEKRGRGQPPYQARGSPSGAAASCDRDWNSDRQIF